MADKEEEYPLETPQEQVLLCGKHEFMPIDMTCEDCEEFICSKCVKEDHKDHDWIPIPTAAILRKRGLLKAMTKIEEENIQHIDEKIQKRSQKIEVNEKRCKSEVAMLQKHYDAIVGKLHKIKEMRENTLKQSLECTNAEVSKDKSTLEEKKKNLLRHVEFLRENSGTMTDIILIKDHRELTKILSTDEVHFTQKSDFLLRHQNGDINEAVLESMMGQTYNAEQITVIETNSFQWSDCAINVLEAMTEDTCLLTDSDLPYFEQVNKSGQTIKQFSVDLNDVCLIDNNEVYVTDAKNNSVSRLSPSDLVSPVFSTDPLEPAGICKTMDGGLLITLRDNESDRYQLNLGSRRLVRHVTLTGDVIHEFEYDEDGQTRLFTWPRRVTQNFNFDVCVLNEINYNSSILLVLSSSGSLKCIYPRHDQRDDYNLCCVVCDSHCNIIASETRNSSIHILSPEGEFLRCLLTKDQVNFPFSMSLKNSTLWIGDTHGCVKVFQYKS